MLERHPDGAGRWSHVLQPDYVPMPDWAKFSRTRQPVHVFVVTNDFPPRIGGINDYVRQLFGDFEPGSVTIFSSSFPGWQAFDRTFPHEVIRLDTEMMLPLPWVRRRLHDELRARRPDILLFGATWPLGHMGPAVRRKLGIPFGGFTHGLELTGALIPGMLRHIGREASLLTAVSEWTRAKLEPAFGWNGRMGLMPSGIDTDRFRPDVSDALVRERHALGDAPVICCVSRLVARKGQDMLIRALPIVHREFPAVRLLIVGSGPYLARLREMAAATPCGDHIVFTGAVSYDELPAYFRAGDIFAMPCRSRLMGLDIEALGAVFLQGAAVGRPVIAGASGGAPEAVKAGETGFAVDPASPEVIAGAVLQLLRDPAQARAMGEAGARWVHSEWTWSVMSERLRGLIASALAKG
jgi:phosphatidylinositol alpha-1,6-mannosyltransferase